MKKTLCVACLWENSVREDSVPFRPPKRAEYTVDGDSLCQAHAEARRRPAAPPSFGPKERKATKPAGQLAKKAPAKKSGPVAP